MGVILTQRLTSFKLLRPSMAVAKIKEEHLRYGKKIRHRTTKSVAMTSGNGASFRKGSCTATLNGSLSSKNIALLNATYTLCARPKCRGERRNMCGGNKQYLLIWQ